MLLVSDDLMVALRRLCCKLQNSRARCVQGSEKKNKQTDHKESVNTIRTDRFLSLLRLSLEAPLLSRDVLGAIGSPVSLVYRTATQQKGHLGLRPVSRVEYFICSTEVNMTVMHLGSCIAMKHTMRFFFMRLIGHKIDNG